MCKLCPNTGTQAKATAEFASHPGIAGRLATVANQAENLVRDLLALKRMNANTVRMSHHDGPTGGVNDPRYAEMGDQLGVLFLFPAVKLPAGRTFTELPPLRFKLPGERYYKFEYLVHTSTLTTQ